MKSFVIRKEGDTTSENFADECINSANQFNITVEKFSGVYNDQEAVLASLGIVPYEKMKPIYKANISHIGCFSSHYLLWVKCVELNEPCLIFEHDAVMIRPLPNNVLTLFTHRLVLDAYAHPYKAEDPTAVYEEKLKDETESVIEYPMQPWEAVKWGFLKHHYARGAHGYIIKPEGAKQLIDSVKKHGWLPGDTVVNHWYTSYTVVTPTIVRISSKMTKKLSHTSGENSWIAKQGQ
jgi:GR25 family glycosyltransferase involved in LPS biosynthesis